MLRINVKLWSANIIKLLPVFLAVTLAGAQEISEQMLPQVTTLSEIERNLILMERDFRNSDPKTFLETCNRLRAELLKYYSTEFKDNKELQLQASQLEIRIDLIEGAIYFYSKDRKKAEELYRKVLSQFPQAVLSGDIASPKLAEFFEDLRDQVTGIISVTSQPDNAEVLINGLSVGRTPLLGMPAQAGHIELRIQHPGYEDFVTLIDVESQKETPVDIQLVKNAGSCSVMTSPVGVTVLIDGHSVGQTRGTPPPELQPELLAQGLDPSDVSEPLMIPAIPVGEHIIEFSKPCYKSLKFKIQVAIGDYFVPPVRLSPSVAGLSIDSRPSGASVYLDDKWIGATPLNLDKVCPGPQILSVRFSETSSWTEHVDLIADQMNVFDAFPRPNLIFLGATCEKKQFNAEAGERILEWLRSSGYFNIPTDEDLKRTSLRPSVSGLMDKLPSYIADPQGFEWQDSALDFASEFIDVKAQLIAVAVLADPRSKNPGFIFFSHPQYAHPDIVMLPPGMPGKEIPSHLKSILAYQPEYRRINLGLTLAQNQKGIFIVKARQGGPLSSENLKQGDLITHVNGKPAASIDQLHQMLAQFSDASSVILTCIASGVVREISLPITWEPAMLPLKQEEYPYNLSLSRLELLQHIKENRNACILNIGICHMALGNPSFALNSIFSNCTLPQSGGISDGTLNFLRSIAAKSMNDTGVVNRYFSESRKNPDSTIMDSDGPLISVITDVGLLY